MKPFLKVGHRFGNVFVRFVHMRGGYRTSTMVKLEPHEAAKIADQIKDAAYRAAKKPATLKFKKGRK